MSIRRLRPFGLVNLMPAVLGLFITSVAGCGGGAATETPPKTTEQAKADAPAAAPEAKAPDAKAEPEAKAPEAKPAGPKEKFALPNVEIKSAAEREKLTIGGKELSAEACLLDTSAPELRHEWFSQAIRSMAIAPDGALIVLDHEHKLRRYVVQPGEACKLGLDPAFGKGGVVAFPTAEVESIEVLDDGTIVGFEFRKIHRYKGGTMETVDCAVKSIDPSGKTGWNSFAGDTQSVDLANECAEKDWKFSGWPAAKGDDDKPSVQFVRSYGKDVVVAASIQGDHFVALHGRDGKLKFRVGKPGSDKKKMEGEQICWARDADACAAGMCVIDSNCRRLSVWDAKKGTLVDAIDINELLGVFYSWPVDLVTAKGGVSYLAISHKEKQPENPPKDHKEMSVGMIYRIKGLN